MSAPKQYNSIKELSAQQDAIRAEYRQMESNLVSNVLDPMRIGKSVLSNLLGFTRNKSRANTSRISGFVNRGGRKNKKAFGLIDAPAEVLPINNSPVLAPQKKNSLGRRIAISFLKWQAFNLAVWGIGKAYEKYKENRAKQAIISDLKAEKQTLLQQIKNKFRRK